MNELTMVEDVKALSPEELGGEIRLLTRQAKTMVLNYGIQIGYRLFVAREKVDNFVEWVERETEFSKSSAYRFIQLYTEYGSGQGGLFGVENAFPTLGKVSISNALRLLALPEEEREEFAAEVDAEHISARELDEAIAARKAAEERAAALEEEKEKILRCAQDDREKLEEQTEAMRRELADVREELDGAQEDRDKLEEELEELKSRPVEVAVQEPDEAALKAAAEKAVETVRAEHGKELDKLRRELAEAEKKKEELAKKLQEPGREAELSAELETARAETEGLRKKLEAAGSGAGEAAIYCRLAQEHFLAAVEKVKAMHETHRDTAEKLLRGLWKIMDDQTERAEELAEEWGVEL